MCSSIVFSPNYSNYRKLAQKHYGLTDEQMIGMDVHHNPPRCEGGRNIPEHLYVYHPELHAQVHEKESILWARKGYETRIKNGTENKKGVKIGGAPPKKTEPTQQELSILKYRQSGFTRKEVADLLGLKEHQVKRAITECSKFGYILHLKPGPKKGCEGKEKSEQTKQIIREKRALQVFTEDTQKKKSDKMKLICKNKTWSRRKIKNTNELPSHSPALPTLRSVPLSNVSAIISYIKLKMKVPVSKKLKEILQDPAARNQLQKALVGEGDGTITVNGKSYTLDKNAFY